MSMTERRDPARNMEQTSLNEDIYNPFLAAVLVAIAVPYSPVAEAELAGMSNLSFWRTRSVITYENVYSQYLWNL